jgi:hypothetical protein
MSQALFTIEARLCRKFQQYADDGGPDDGSDSLVGEMARILRAPRTK